MADAKRAEEAEQYASMLEDQIAEKDEQIQAVMEEGTQAVQRVEELEQELVAAKNTLKLEQAETAQYASHLEEELADAQSQTAELVAEGKKVEKELEAVQGELAAERLNRGNETEGAHNAAVEAAQREVQDLRDTHARALQDLSSAYEKKTKEASEYTTHLEAEIAEGTNLTATLQQEYDAIDAERVSAVVGLEAAEARVRELETFRRLSAEAQQQMEAQIESATSDSDRFQSELLEVCSCPPALLPNRSTSRTVEIRAPTRMVALISWRCCP